MQNYGLGKAVDLSNVFKNERQNRSYVYWFKKWKHHGAKIDTDPTSQSTQSARCTRSQDTHSSYVGSSETWE